MTKVPAVMAASKIRKDRPLSFCSNEAGQIDPQMHKMQNGVNPPFLCSQKPRWAIHPTISISIKHVMLYMTCHLLQTIQMYFGKSKSHSLRQRFQALHNLSWIRLQKTHNNNKSHFSSLIRLQKTRN